MDIGDALTFLRQHHNAVMATTRSDGTTVGVDGEDRVVVSSRETAYKVKQLRARPRAAICAFTDRFYGEWVQVEGPVEILSLPEALEPLVDYYRDIRGEHPDWDEYRSVMVRDRRVIIRLTVERAGPTLSG
jgi:PPOX class probable F420-dependent enzyme